MSRTTRRGVTLTEVLVVVAIFAILVGLTLPATRRVRGAAERARCTGNLKQLILALHNAHDASDRPLTPPPAAGTTPATPPHFPPGCFGPGTAPEERLSWTVAILPFMEQDTLYGRFSREQGYAENSSAAQTTIKTFLCPVIQGTAQGEGVTHYVAMSGVGLDAAHRPAGAAGIGFMGYDRMTSLLTIRDGASNTVALLETRVDVGPWARGGTSTVRGFEPGAVANPSQMPFGGHPNAIGAAMADGSVRAFLTHVDPALLTAAITVAGGEEVNLD
ncbi:DUF1559 family PulG-like putative transporter [Gemmata sp.]|uniref:DUF1559 family PulG-like putative transporter n=1 Tax=Gemmata sp. TaxID=1914242 RepID=UPI003F71C5A3